MLKPTLHILYFNRYSRFVKGFCIDLSRQFSNQGVPMEFSLTNWNLLLQMSNFLYILQAGENSHRSSVCDCITFLFRFTADLSPQQVRRSILFMREQPHGAAKNSSTETRLLYVCLVIYTVCRLPCHLKCRIAFSANLVIGRHGSQQAGL